MLGMAFLAAWLTACQSAASTATMPPPSIPPPPPPTSTSTPLPTPTYNPAVVVTRTPAPRALCPTLKPSTTFDFSDNLQTAGQELLAYLNAGGDPAHIGPAFDAWSTRAPGQGGRAASMDVTGDAVPEVLVDVYQSQADTYQQSFIFGCQAGAYRIFANWISRQAGQRYDFPVVKDLNGDGVPEIVVASRSGRAPNLYLSVLIYEWNGRDFTSLVAGDDTLVNGSYELDTTPNGTSELVVRGGQWVAPDGSLVPPDKENVETWTWNGQQFAQASTQQQLRGLVFRFQAVQEGDAAARAGQFDYALALYDQAIMDDTLLSWSPEWPAWATAEAEATAGTPATPAPTPVSETAEHSRLEIYARYRIMVLYVILGYDNEAQVEYTLLSGTPASSAGAAYAQLAAAFWDGYQPGHQLAAGCAQAIEYARNHSAAVLDPLGSRVYGSAHPDYAPEDICPFK